jgi:hypothetical protein
MQEGISRVIGLHCVVQGRLVRRTRVLAANRDSIGLGVPLERDRQSVRNAFIKLAKHEASILRRIGRAAVRRARLASEWSLRGYSRSPPKSWSRSRKMLKMSRKMLAAIGTALARLAKRSRLKSKIVNAPKTTRPTTA